MDRCSDSHRALTHPPPPHPLHPMSFTACWAPSHSPSPNLTQSWTHTQVGMATHTLTLP